MFKRIRIVNQSKYVKLTSELKTEIVEQAMDLGDAFSGPVVIRDISEYEGRYFAVSCGQVWSFLKPYTTKLDEHPHRIGKNCPKDGYSHGTVGMFHVVIAQTFNVPNDDSEHKVCINHKDEIKSHNYVIFNDDLTLNAEKSNLEWCTYAYNLRYSHTVEKSIASRRGKPSPKKGKKYGPNPKISASKKGKPSPLKGIKRGPESLETRRKKSIAFTGRVSPNKGKHWKKDSETGKRVYFD